MWVHFCMWVHLLHVKKCTNMDVSIVFTCYKCMRIQKCTHMTTIFTCKKCTHIQKCTHITFMWVQFILYGYTLCEITLNLISYICYYTNVLSNCLNNNRMKKIIHINIFQNLISSRVG